MAARIFGDDDAGERRAREDERERRRESTRESPSRARATMATRARRIVTRERFIRGGWLQRKGAKKRNAETEGNVLCVCV